MLVTCDVSQLDTSALKDAHAGLHPRFAPYAEAQKMADMSVTADTSQKWMSPYVAIAVAGLAHQASRACSSDARSAKIVDADGAEWCPPACALISAQSTSAVKHASLPLLDGAVTCHRLSRVRWLSWDQMPQPHIVAPTQWRKLSPQGQSDLASLDTARRNLGRRGGDPGGSRR
jgi:hypothetical protein